MTLPLLSLPVPPSSDANLKFSSVDIPNISLKDYFARISKYSECSQACYIIALIYLDRAMIANPQLIINSYCVHRYLRLCRLALISIMIAAKFWDDYFLSNYNYGQIGGMTCEEIHMLEMGFLALLEFSLYVDEDTYNAYIKKLQSFLSRIAISN
jgi:hypothetical protein